MARIRTIKPEFPQSESMGRVSRDARLCFIMMWTIADDAGRLRGNSRMLASLLFPYDDDAPKRMDDWLAELDGEGCIARYEVDGNAYVQIEKWTQHQRIDKPSESKIPAFAEASRKVAKPREPSCQDLGPRTGTKEGTKDLSQSARADRASEDRDFENLWSGWQEHKVAKGSKKDALEAWKTCVRKAGVDPGAVLEAARAYCAQCLRTDIGTKHVCRWLKKSGWEDDYGPPLEVGSMVDEALRRKWELDDDGDKTGNPRDGHQAPGGRVQAPARQAAIAGPVRGDG